MEESVNEKNGKLHSPTGPPLPGATNGNNANNNSTTTSNQQQQQQQASSIAHKETQKTTSETTPTSTPTTSNAIPSEKPDNRKKPPPSPSPSSTSNSTTNSKRKPSPGTMLALNKSYLQLIQEAILDMKDRTGSSLPRLKQWILSHYPDLGGPHFNSRLNKALRNGVAAKPPKLIKIRASYKVPIEFKNGGRKGESSSSASASTTNNKNDANNKAPSEAAQRSEMLKRRHYPMEDTALHTQDRQWRVVTTVPPRPSLPYVWQLLLPHLSSGGKTPGPILAGSRVDPPGRGLVPDIVAIYHVLPLLPQHQHQQLPPITLHNLFYAVEQVLNGNVRKCKQVPPLLVHLFCTCLQYLLSGQGLTSSRAESHLYTTELHTYLQPVVTPANWSDVTHLYMDAMERYTTTTSSSAAAADAPELGFAVRPEGVVVDAALYLQADPALQRAHYKLSDKDPWFLTAEELVALLRALTDDVLALFPGTVDAREELVQSAVKEKRAADTKFRKVKLAYEGPPPKKNGKGKDATATATTKPFQPTVSKKQYEIAKRAQEKANQAYEEALEKGSTRTEPLGLDRHHNAVYHGGAMILVEERKTVSQQQALAVPPEQRRMWYAIDTTSLLDSYVASLDGRGRREHDLKRALEPLRECMLTDDVGTREQAATEQQERTVLKERLEQAQKRCGTGRSGRLAETAEEELREAQDAWDTFCTAHPDPVASNSGADKDYVELTGLAALREFEEGNSVSSRRKRKKEEEESAFKLPLLHCSKLVSSGEVDGTGLVGMVVASILELEEHCQSVVPWARGDRPREIWISKVKGAVHAWNSISPFFLGPSETSNTDSNGATDTPSGAARRASNEAKRRKTDSPSCNINSSEKVSTILAVLRQPLLDLEERVADITNVALAARDADMADDNISVVDEKNDAEKPKVEQWKRLAHKIRNTPSRKYGQIRQMLVDAIASARKSHLPAVVSQLRAALLLYHPSAAGDCKTAVVKVLVAFGDYDEDDDDEEEEIAPKDAADDEETIPSVLSAQAVILRSSLGGSDDAKREDWTKAVLSAKTISRFASLTAGFVHDAMEKIKKLEVEREAFLRALIEWKKDKEKIEKGRGNKGRKKLFRDPSEVWTHVDYTDEICMAKAEDFPWWPARKCIPKDASIAASLADLDRCIVAFVGEMGGLRVVKLADQLQPFTGEMIQEPDASYSKTMRNSLDECMIMARRLNRGIEKKKAAVRPYRL